MGCREWAEDQAERHLAPLGRRWAHTRAVAAGASRVGRVLDLAEHDLLVAAAYLHDVGYAPALALTGFHPLDGARWLAGLGHERLACLVAHHSGAKHEAGVRGLSAELGVFPEEKSVVALALAYCDVTTGPDGQLMTPEERLADVEVRHGSDSPVAVGLRRGWSELLEAVVAMETRLQEDPASQPM